MGEEIPKMLNESPHLKRNLESLTIQGFSNMWFGDNHSNSSLLSNFKQFIKTSSFCNLQYLDLSNQKMNIKQTLEFSAILSELVTPTPPPSNKTVAPSSTTTTTTRRSQPSFETSYPSKGTKNGIFLGLTQL